MSWLARIRAALGVLRHGLPTAAARDTIEIAEADLVEVVEGVFALVGLPYSWPGAATSDELRALARATKFAAEMRDRDWERMEVGTWPR